MLKFSARSKRRLETRDSRLKRIFNTVIKCRVAQTFSGLRLHVFPDPQAHRVCANPGSGGRTFSRVIR